MRGQAMVKNARGMARLFILFLVVFFGFQPAGSYEKKLRVVSDYAHIYLSPDEESPVIATLDRGSVLSLLYSGKANRTWYYVCFKSEKTGVTKSGYVADSVVELLYATLKVITIKEENESDAVKYTPRKFEEMKWGLSKKEVLELEGKPLSQERQKGQDIMKYQQKVINLDCSIEYVFASNKLSRTKFLFMNEHINKNSYLEDYRSVKDALIQRFGKPQEENMNWHDESYKNDFSNWGEAISLGQLELSSRWLTTQTEIMASLSGGNEEIYLLVEYSGLQTKDLARKGLED